MQPCPECGTITNDHPSWCQTGAEEYEDEMMMKGEPGYVVNDEGKEGES